MVKGKKKSELSKKKNNKPNSSDATTEESSSIQQEIPDNYMDILDQVDVDEIRKTGITSDEDKDLVSAYVSNRIAKYEEEIKQAKEKIERCKQIGRIVSGYLLRTNIVDVVFANIISFFDTKSSLQDFRSLIFTCKAFRDLCYAYPPRMTFLSSKTVPGNSVLSKIKVIGELRIVINGNMISKLPNIRSTPVVVASPVQKECCENSGKDDGTMQTEESIVTTTTTTTTVASKESSLIDMIDLTDEDGGGAKKKEADPFAGYVKEPPLKLNEKMIEECSKYGVYHAKRLVLDFGLSQRFRGDIVLRFLDPKYVEYRDMRLVPSDVVIPPGTEEFVFYASKNRKKSIENSTLYPHREQYHGFWLNHVYTHIKPCIADVNLARAIIKTPSIKKVTIQAKFVTSRFIMMVAKYSNINELTICETLHDISLKDKFVDEFLKHGKLLFYRDCEVMHNYTDQWLFSAYIPCYHKYQRETKYFETVFNEDNVEEIKRERKIRSINRAKRTRESDEALEKNREKKKGKGAREKKSDDGSKTQKSGFKDLSRRIMAALTNVVESRQSTQAVQNDGENDDNVTTPTFDSSDAIATDDALSGDSSEDLITIGDTDDSRSEGEPEDGPPRKKMKISTPEEIHDE